MFEIYVLAYQIGIQIFRWSAEKANYITSVNFYSRLHCIRMGYSLSHRNQRQIWTSTLLKTAL